MAWQEVLAVGGVVGMEMGVNAAVHICHNTTAAKFLSYFLKLILPGRST